MINMKFLEKIFFFKRNYYKDCAKKDSSEIIKSIKKINCRSLFIDCGSNKGQGFVFFKKYFKLKYFDYILVEPNPNCVFILKNKFQHLFSNSLVNVIDKAAFINDGEVQLFGLSGESDKCNEFNQGASISTIHNSIYYKTEESESITVQTFSLSDFILSKSLNYSNIVLKLDIEGAEYDVLDDLIRSNAIKIPKVLYIEFHSKYMGPENMNKFQEKEKYFVRYFKENNIIYRDWR